MTIEKKEIMVVFDNYMKTLADMPPQNPEEMWEDAKNLTMKALQIDEWDFYEAVVESILNRD